MAGKVRAGVIADLLKSWHEFQHAIPPGSRPPRAQGISQIWPSHLRGPPYIFAYIREVGSRRFCGFSETAAWYLELYAARYRSAKLGRLIIRLPLCNWLVLQMSVAFKKIRLQTDRSAIKAPVLGFPYIYIWSLDNLYNINILKSL